MDSRKSFLIATLERVACSEVRFSDHLSATTTRGGKVIGFSESQGRGRASTADVNADGTISLTVTGSSSLGEQDTLKSCQLLIERLNKPDPLWSQPILGTHPAVDAEATAVGCDDTFHMQVVRAITNSEFWRELGRLGASGFRNVTPTEAASGIRDSILHKASSIPPSDRSRLVLVLNSIDSPSLVLDPVIEAFLLMHQLWTRSLGFREIWIVGPWSDLSYRLD